MNPDPNDEVIRIFVSYARRDKRWFDKDYEYNLIPWLAESLKKQNVVFWYDEELVASEVFARRIEEEIDKAHIALLIVSQCFLNSEFIETHELSRIKERAEQGALAVVPVLVEPCSWDEDDFLSERQMLPGKPTPLINYTVRLPEWAQVRDELRRDIKKLAEKIRAAKKQERDAQGRQRQQAKTVVLPNSEADEKKSLRREQKERGQSEDATTADCRIVHARDQARRESQSKPGDAMTMDLGKGASMDLVWCPPGSFQMGSPEAELGRFADEVQHRVMLTRGVWIGKFPVTRGQWEAVVGKDLSASESSGKDTPVETASWDDCQGFLAKLHLLKVGAVPGASARLPTEAEWEYACRAGTETALNSGKELTSADGICENLDAVAWYDRNSSGSTHRVGQKAPNAWGIYDMHGNVWEWCADWIGGYPNGDATDPTGPPSGSGRVVRGGSWYGCARSCRSAGRSGGASGRRASRFGFRVVVAER